tara:strand:- start:269 stop:1324 length:1056 start_codon:yes stop_codon:yes gene_type:complete
MAQLCVCVKQPKKQTLVYKELEINLVSKDENRSDTMNATTAIDLSLTPNETPYALATRFLLKCVEAERLNHTSVILHKGNYLPDTCALYRNPNTQATQEVNLDTLRENIVDMCTVTHKGKKNYTGTCTHATIEGLMSVGHAYTPKDAEKSEIRFAVAHRMSTQVGKVRAVFFPNVKSADKDTRNANWDQFKLWARKTWSGAGAWHTPAENKEAMMFIGSQNVTHVMNYREVVAPVAEVAAPALVSHIDATPAIAAPVIPTPVIPTPAIPTVAATPVVAPVPATEMDAELAQMLADAGIIVAPAPVAAPVAAPVQVDTKATLVAQVVAAGHMSKSLAERTSVDTLTILANLQ